jgi:hypothetical protein
MGEPFEIQYKNYTEVSKADYPAFAASFHPPPQEDCRLSCDGLREQGKLRSYEEAWGSIDKRFPRFKN